MNLALAILAVLISLFALAIAIYSELRMRALAQLEFDEKRAVLTREREFAESQAQINIETASLNFQAVSNIRRWIPKEKRSALITLVVKPIVESALKNEEILKSFPQAKALEQMITTAIQYGVEADRFRDFLQQLQRQSSSTKQKKRPSKN